MAKYALTDKFTSTCPYVAAKFAATTRGFLLMQLIFFFRALIHNQRVRFSIIVSYWRIIEKFRYLRQLSLRKNNFVS